MSDLVRVNNYPYNQKVNGFLPIWNEKQLDFLSDYTSRVDFLEGTIRSSKTVVGVHKFILRISQSSTTQFVVGGKSATAARRNFIDNEAGILAQFGNCITIGKDIKKGNHLILHTKTGDKLIYIIGLKDKSKWEDILGSTLGGIFLDEINIANISCVHELLGRMATVDDRFMICTANPDNPEKDVYSLLNQCRPYTKYSNEIPDEIKEELKKVSPLDKWVYWYFSFRDNPAISDESKMELMSMYPPSSVYFKTKIQGVRAVGEGSVFAEAISVENEYTPKINLLMSSYKELYINDIFENKFHDKTFGIDLGSGEDGAAKSMICLTGFYGDYQDQYVVDGKVCKQKESVAMCQELVDFILKWKNAMPNKKFKGIYIDGFGAVKVVMETLKKMLIENGININVSMSYKFGESVKTEKGITKGGSRKEREELLNTLLCTNRLKFYRNSTWAMDCLKYLKLLIYDKTGFVEDKNKLQNDYYDTLCYSLTRFTYKLIRR